MKTSRMKTMNRADWQIMLAKMTLPELFDFCAEMLQEIQLRIMEIAGSEEGTGNEAT